MKMADHSRVRKRQRDVGDLARGDVALASPQRPIKDVEEGVVIVRVRVRVIVPPHCPVRCHRDVGVAPQ